jgi:hypothetical protein
VRLHDDRPVPPTSFEDHAERASVDVSEAVRDALPCGSGLRLYVDRTVAYEARLLDATVAPSASDEELRLREATDRRRSEGFTGKLGDRTPCAVASCSSLSR